MKYIKLYEGFYSEMEDVRNKYVNKVKDCCLYLTDNYYADIFYKNSEFHVEMEIDNTFDLNELKDNIVKSADRLTNDLHMSDMKIHLGMDSTKIYVCPISMINDKFVHSISTLFSAHSNKPELKYKLTMNFFIR